MEKREDVLRETLAKNEEEIQRWEAYIKENETAIQCLNKFSKMLEVEVMVPVGQKAYMPGRLIHTNEVLVGHYQDYFSKCSAYTATQICQRRIENGKQHLKDFETEKDLFQNKLEKPYLDGALPNSEQHEIIEEYDDVKEKLWREQHRQRIREAKIKEKEQRDEETSQANKIDDLTRMPDEEELLKELEEELSDGETDPNSCAREIVHKLMSGEMNLPPPKTRIAHNAKATTDKAPELKSTEHTAKSKSEETISNIHGKLTESRSNSNRNYVGELADGNESDTSTTSDTPEEICLIEKQAEYLPQSDRMGFYRYQLQIVNKKLTVSFTNCKELEEKLRLFKVRDHLEELIEILEETPSSETESQLIDDAEIEEMEGKPPKRRISFALEDQMLEFRKNEAVAQMIAIKYPTEEDNPKRDVVLLDEPALRTQQPVESEGNESNTIDDRKKAILDRVEENMKTQNVKDADLVTKILSANKVQTLHIYFNHSSELADCTNDVKTNIPTNPGDLYKMYREEGKSDLPDKQVDTIKGEMCDSDATNVDQLISDSGEKVSNELQCKSILKNKLAVHRETHITEKEEKPIILTRKIKPKADDDYLTAYNRVVGDVIEKPLAEPNSSSEIKIVTEKEDKETTKIDNLIDNKEIVDEVIKKPLTKPSSKTKSITEKKDKPKISEVKTKQKEKNDASNNEAVGEVTERIQTEPDPLPQGKFVDMHSPKKRISRFKQMRTENK